MQNRKHAVQEISLIIQMQSCGLLQPKNVFLEFGSGRGNLSRDLADYFVHFTLKKEKTENSTENSLFFMIDRQVNYRKKAERIPLQTGSAPLNRIGIDIKDFDLKSFKEISQRNSVIFGKVPKIF